jgi:hypothetical protein
LVSPVEFARLTLSVGSATMSKRYKEPLRAGCGTVRFVGLCSFVMPWGREGESSERVGVERSDEVGIGEGWRGGLGSEGWRCRRGGEACLGE